MIEAKSNGFEMFRTSDFRCKPSDYVGRRVRHELWHFVEMIQIKWRFQKLIALKGVTH